MGLWHAFSSTEKEKTMLNEKEFYQYVEANILNYLPEMEGKKVMVQRVKRNNQISMMGLSIGETKNYLVPVLYLEIFYRNYLRGQELSDTMKDIARIYRGHQVGFIWMRIKFQIMSILRRICFIVWLIMRRIKRC